MIKTPITLVLGAGASYPYNYPTGRELLLQVAKSMADGEQPYRGIFEGLGYGEQIFEFAKALRGSHLPSIDEFVENRREFIEIGKCAIASYLIPHEDDEKLVRPYTVSRDRQKQQWYELLFSSMGTTLENFKKSTKNLNIVTFNYDRSLEYFIFNSIIAAFGLEHEDAVRLFKQISIEHVYGQLGEPHFVSDEGRGYQNVITWSGASKNTRMDHVAVSMQSIRTISEATKEDLQPAVDLITGSKKVCFLGFGYHPTNMERLDIPNSLDSKQREVVVFGTGFGLKYAEREQAIEHIRTHPKNFGGEDEDCVSFLRNHPVLV